MTRRYINTEQLKNLVNIFSVLNEDRQKKTMVFIQEQLLLQNAEENLSKERKKISEEEIESAANKRAEDILNVMDRIDKMDDEQKAAFLMLIEKYAPGAFTKDENIEIVIKNKTVALENAVKSMLPGVDIIAAKQTYHDFQNIQTNKEPDIE